MLPHVKLPWKLSHVKCGGSIFCLMWREIWAQSEKDCGAWEWFIAKYVKSRDPRHDWMQRKLIIVDFHLLHDRGSQPSSTGDNPLNNCNKNYAQKLSQLSWILICLQQIVHRCSFWNFATAHLLAMVARINLTNFNRASIANPCSATPDNESLQSKETYK